MKALVSLGILLVFGAVLTMPDLAQASTTSAYAAISKSGHGAANQLDSDSAFGYCQSYANADCPDDGNVGCVAWASTTATVTVGFGQGPTQIVGTSITNNNQETQLYPGHAFTNNGSANFASFNAKLIGQGLQAQAKFILSTLAFKVPFGPGMKTITTNLALDNSTVYWGSYTLSGSGNETGTGIFIDSFFDVFLEADGYRAVYNGPPELPFNMPVNQTFSLILDSSMQGDSVVVTGETFSLGLTIPAGYDYLIPEPASLTLLALGGLMLLRRRSDR